MPNVPTTTTTNSAIIPEIWSARFYEVLSAKLPFIDCVSRDYEGEVRSLGDIVNISSVPEFSAATDLAEGVAGDADAVTVSGQQLTINKNPSKDFIVTNRAQLQSLPFVDKLREMAVHAILKKVQDFIIAAIVPSAAAPDHAITYGSATTLALADILAAKELLDAADVPEESRKAVMGSAQWNDLYNIAGFTSKDYSLSNDGVLASGQVGRAGLLGFDPRFTTVLGNTSYFFHPSFMTMAVQQQMNIEVLSMGAEGVRGTRVNCDLLMGLKQLDNKRVVSIS